MGDGSEMAEWLMRFAVNGVGAPIESSNLSLTMKGGRGDVTAFIVGADSLFGKACCS